MKQNCRPTSNTAIRSRSGSARTRSDSLPVATVALFVFLFLRWAVAHPSGYPAYTQNALQTIWGGVSVDPVTTKALDADKPHDYVEKNPLMLLYVVLVILVLVLLLAPLMFDPAGVHGYHPFIRAI